MGDSLSYLIVSCLPPRLRLTLHKKKYKIVEYREIATLMFLPENQSQLARKLSARKFQGLFIEHNPD